MSFCASEANMPVEDPKGGFPRKAQWTEENATRRIAGNWVAALSEVSMSSPLTAPHALAPVMDGETDFHDCEPELLRITSIESEANTEALFRLFGRKRTVQSRYTPVSLVHASERSPAEGEVGSWKPVIAPSEAPFLFCGGQSPDSPLSPVDGGALPDSPHGHAVSSSSYQGETGAEVDSGSCPGGGDEERTGTARPEATCSVDVDSWQNQSLDDILCSKPFGIDRNPSAACPCEGFNNPREILDSSLIGLIPDPAVRAKIRSLQLFTVPGIVTPCEPPGQDAAGVQDEEAEADGEELDSPCREDSPPPLRRTYTAKREEALEECWLTGNERRRKACELGDFTDCEDDLFKRRRF